MARKSKTSEKHSLVVIYGRVEADDYAEMKRQEEKTGAPIAAQIRILVRDGLRKGKAVIK